MWSLTNSGRLMKQQLTKFLVYRAISNKPLYKLSKEERSLVIHKQCDDVTTYEFPYVWLRDNCQCSQCFLASSRSRAFLLRNLDINIKPLHVSTQDERTVQIDWSDQHSSTFDLEWLKQRSFTQDIFKQRRAFHRLPIKQWGEDMQDNIPRLDFNHVLQNDDVLHKFLVNLEETGLQLLHSAPKLPGAIAKIAERIAFLKRNNYGETFTVKSKWNASNLAYTGVTLGLHTDLPFYHYTPGVQMLHCIEQTVDQDGGANTFADGFFAANIMKKEHADLYKVLLDCDVDYYDVGVDAYKFHKLTMVPVIQEDEHGEVYKITYNNQVRDSHLTLPVDQVYHFYKALTTFERLVSDSRCCITHKLQPGEIVCFHNYRVLHGRRGYKALGDGERHLEGGYIDWDELRSKRRVLETQINT